jgi:iron complex transport system ATP-binding protein
MSLALEAARATYEVGGRALVEDADVRVEHGSVLAIVGPNGAGKSTLLRLLAGELEPTAGEVRVLGRRVADWRARELARVRAVMPQQTVLQFAFTAGEVVAMGRSPHRDDGHGPVERALARTETTALVPRSFPTLSGGEQARVTLARVLAQEPAILLLDEPTASLDVRHQELALRLARRLAEEGKAVVAVLHDLNAAAAYADEIAVLKHGRVVAHGPPWLVLTEDVLHDVFEHRVLVVPHPVCDCPLVVAGPAHVRS